MLMVCEEIDMCLVENLVENGRRVSPPSDELVWMNVGGLDVDIDIEEEEDTPASRYLDHVHQERRRDYRRQQEQQICEPPPPPPPDSRFGDEPHPARDEPANETAAQRLSTAERELYAVYQTTKELEGRMRDLQLTNEKLERDNEVLSVTQLASRSAMATRAQSLALQRLRGRKSISPDDFTDKDTVFFDQLPTSSKKTSSVEAVAVVETIEDYEYSIGCVHFNVAVQQPTAMRSCYGVDSEEEYGLGCLGGFDPGPHAGASGYYK